MSSLASLGIDGWSLLLYLVNVGLLLAVLTKFLYRPLLKFLDERRETVRRNITEAEELKKRFSEEAEKQEKATAEMMSQMQAEVASAKATAQEQARQLVREAEEQRESLLSETRAEVDRMKAGLVSEVEQEILRKMENVIVSVVKRDVPEEAVRKSVAAGWQSIKKEVVK